MPFLVFKIEMIKKVYYYIIGILAIIGMTSCSSGRRTAQDKFSVTSEWKKDESVVARANVRFEPSKGKGASVGGVLRMKRDDVVQLNLTYILGIQIGTLELTPDNVLIVSKATRQYSVFDYSELSEFVGRKIIFDDLQSIFWGEADRFDVKGLQWKYGSFTTMQDGRRLPEELSIEISKGTESVGISISMSNYKFEQNEVLRTKINTSNYTRLAVDQVLKMINLLLEG